MRYVAPLRVVVLSIACCVLLAGCTPRVIVRANPTKADPGIRYYRPKPYLKIEPAEISVARDQSEIVPGLVRISLVYMPDFSEEYAIDVRSGLGTANVGIKLEDGWNLTEIDQDLDSQTDENISAVGDLLSGLGDVVPTAADRGASDVSFTVPAHNVPIGFYESVIGRDGHGCKRLYGFRYVGFIPFSPCPLNMTGHDHAVCNDMCGTLYGLAFIGGQMVFQPLDVMATSPVEALDAAGDPQATATPSGDRLPPEAMEPVDLDLLAVDLRTHLLAEFGEVGEVRVERDAVVLGIDAAASYSRAQALLEETRRYLDADPRLTGRFGVRVEAR